MNKNYLLLIVAFLIINLGLAASPEKRSSVLAVDFTVSDTLTCSGIVKFTDLSNNGATAWLWNFGDGGAATVQNPAHTYTASGYYTVRLITLGIAGIDSVVKVDYVHVDFLTAPVVSVDTTVCQYNPAVLTAVGTSGTTVWYDSIAGGNLLFTGDTFTTGSLLATSTFYASSQFSSGSAFGGPADSSLGGGSIYTANADRTLVFDCSAACRLVSVKVYAQGAGPRTIYLDDNNGNTINTITVNVPDGESRVTLNFDIQPGTDYELGCAGPPDLYRNNTGASYPYDVNGVISIIGNNAGGGAGNFYYFFYDWEVSNPPCVSPRVPVNVTVTPGPQASFITSQNLNIINVLELSLGATSWSWDFGDGSAIDTLQNPAPHVYAAAGSYNITLTVSNGTCSSSLVIPVVISTAAGLNQLNAANISLMPNPVKDMLTINLTSVVGKVALTLTSSLGQVVYSSNGAELKNEKTVLNLSALKAGIYVLKIESNDGVVLKKIVKE
jgi:PKD repeat protein